MLVGCGSSRKPPHPLVVNADSIATFMPGDSFNWPADTTITSLDECTLALPADIVGQDVPIGKVIAGDDEMGFNMPNGENKIYLRLMPQMSVTVRVDCTATIVGTDDAERRLKVLPAPVDGT